MKPQFPADSLTVKLSSICSNHCVIELRTVSGSGLSLHGNLIVNCVRTAIAIAISRLVKTRAVVEIGENSAAMCSQTVPFDKIEYSNTRAGRLERIPYEPK